MNYPSVSINKLHKYEGSCIRAKDLANHLGVHPKTISKWSRDGLIASIKISSRVVVFEHAEIARFLESCRTNKSKNG
jgi:predicted site-specific integrase-resolvase